MLHLLYSGNRKEGHYLEALSSAFFPPLDMKTQNSHSKISHVPPLLMSLKVLCTPLPSTDIGT